MAWIAIGLVVLVQSVVFFDSYHENKAVFITHVENSLEESVQLLNLLSTDNSRGGISRQDDTTLLILREQVRHIHRLDKTMDINESFLRAFYDIHDSQQWNLTRLADIFREKMSKACPPFIFTRMDSLENQLEYWKYKTGDDKKENYENCTILLGFLDGHQLTVYFTFTWNYFLWLEWKDLTGVFFLLSLVVTSLVLFAKNLRKWRARVEHQELLVQALSHDLKSPIGELQLMSHQIKTCSSVEYSTRQKELYLDSQKKTNEILRSIDRLLHDTMDVRGLFLRLEPVDLRVLLENQISGLLASVTDKKQVEVVPLFQMPCRVIQADGHHLSRVVSNLLRNAVKYSGEKVVIRLTCRCVERYVEIRIEDDGYGIEKADFKNIFEKNFQTALRIEGKKIKGFGIGLSYAKTIVKAHRGTIQVESQPGKGSVFTIRLKIGRYGRKN